MSGRDTLALLIPAYNAAAYLPRLLASAAAQTEPFDEIWVYDDCSTDDTAAIAESLGAKVIRGEVNLGQSAGKNALAAQVGADWIHFHDADDELSSNFVVLARNWIAKNCADVVLFAYEERDAQTGEFMATARFDPDDLARDPRSYAIRTQICTICGLYRRETFLNAGGYDVDRQVLYNDDVAMHIGLAFAGLTFAAEPEVAIINHRHSDSFSSASPLKCIQAHYHVMRKTADRAGARAYTKDIAVKLWRASGVLAAYLDWETADAAVALARKLAPSFVEGSPAFRALAGVSAPFALRLREGLIRKLRPRTRDGYPSGARGRPATEASR